MARVNKTQFAVLGTLMIAPMSAYGIKRFMAKSTEFFWTESEGQLYPTLKKMTEDGDVEVESAVSEKGLPKKIYTITEQGEERFSQWLRAGTDRLLYRNEMLLKVFFGSFEEACVTVDLLLAAKKAAEQELSILERLLEEIPGLELDDRRDVFIMLPIEFGIKYLRAEIEWCNHGIEKLNELID